MTENNICAEVLREFAKNKGAVDRLSCDLKKQLLGVDSCLGIACEECNRRVAAAICKEPYGEVKESFAKIYSDMDSDLEEYYECKGEFCDSCKNGKKKSLQERYGNSSCTLLRYCDIGARLERQNAKMLETFDLDAFKRREFSVRCDTQEDYNDFMSFLNYNGVRWGSGKSTIEKVYGFPTCKYFVFGDGGLLFSTQTVELAKHWEAGEGVAR